MKVHPYAELFPMMEGDEFERFKGDIAANGQKQPIVVMMEGRERVLLDGRNRYRACKELGFIPDERVLSAKDDPLTFVLSLNLSRRHLDETQRSIVAAKLANMTVGGDRRSDHSANLQNVSQATAAELLNVSARSVASAREVIDKAEPEILRAAERGKIAVSAAAKAAGLPKDQQQTIAAKAEAGEARAVQTVIKQGVRDEREFRLAQKQCALPDRRYGVILADPEWQFEVYSRETGLDRSADNHYPTSGMAEIRARDVASIAADDCVLFLWSTVPFLVQALGTLDAWGFKYVSHAMWRKDRKGTGYWFINEHEVLLVGTRGDIPCPAPGTQWGSVIEAPAGGHSAKPDKFHELIEEYFPHLPRIELNRRGPAREGWDVWGNEAEQQEIAA